ncbi:hypothetical protein N0V86_004352 [Didymella sp. IMI 355093]|nr:hypothetical protein N0V86_004352 [Didymella sp. IMI 355093]
MSYDRYSITPIEEEWHDLMNWDEGASPTNVRNDDSTDFFGREIPGLHFPYMTSAPPSNYGGPSSFDNNVSAAQSVNGASSSYGQFHSTSPRGSSTATSPFAARDELRYFGSFDACENMFSPLGEAKEPPLLDTTRERIMDSTSSLATTAGNFLNPHVPGSFQTFSNRDVLASQILASTGTQFDPCATSEPIAEGRVPKGRKKGLDPKQRSEAALMRIIVLTAPAVASLTQDLDAHLARLVMTEFSAFPLYVSQLRTLRSVYIFFRSSRTDSKETRVLLQALKLLVLVHVGGDITLPEQTESRFLARLIHDTMDVSSDHRPTPCFIRSQFGAIMPELAQELMRGVLSSLELLLLGRNEEDWPVTLAILMVVLMTVESIHYHSAKRPYHEAIDTAHTAITSDLVEIDNQSVDKLLTFYNACFYACHTRLRPNWEGELDKGAGRASASDTFIKNMREAISNASPSGYLVRKAHQARCDDEDMGFYFDRLVARLLLLEVQA